MENDCEADQTARAQSITADAAAEVTHISTGQPERGQHARQRVPSERSPEGPPCSTPGMFGRRIGRA